ncbi:MAG: energy-coupling factor transporter transmembrane protein EcfT [Treponema sp.]|jgi:biotin transport system permease protein|nr:energy-coupling factor transporter transmembrane protein EcfT [Treponema sp.]
MAYGVSPYTYRPGNTFLHRLPAGVKLLGLLAISLGSFFSGPGLFLSTAILLVGAVSAKILPWDLFRGIKPLVIMIGLVIIFRSFRFNLPRSLFPELNLPGFWAGIRFGGGIMISFSAGALLFSVTTMTELKDSLGSAETFIRICGYNGIKKIQGKPIRTVSRNSPVSLGISLMLNFLPRFFEAWEEAEVAYRARAGKKGIPALILLIPLVTERMITLAVETAYAMESRGASLEGPPA